MTFWVPVQGANTVEGRQYMRAVVNPSNSRPRVLGRRDADGQRPALHQRRRATGAPMQDFTGTRQPVGARTPTGRRTSAAPVEFSVANAGTLGVVKVAEQWRRATDTAAAPDRHRHRRRRPVPTSTR